jgi:hypothetical protein
MRRDVTHTAIITGVGSNKRNIATALIPAHGVDIVVTPPTIMNRTGTIATIIATRFGFTVLLGSKLALRRVFEFMASCYPGVRFFRAIACLRDQALR